MTREARWEFQSLDPQTGMMLWLQPRKSSRANVLVSKGSFGLRRSNLGIPKMIKVNRLL